MSNTSEHSQVEWKDLNWRKLEKVVQKLQNRIYQASTHGDLKALRKLQKTLLRSWSAKLLAVRRVTQDNQGKVTAGVDGVKNLKPQQRLQLAKNLKLTGKASPTRRVYIPKPGKDEKRPLGIPTMADRALQALAKLALEPEWEAKFHANSYGFRPGRSAHDAIEAIFLNLRHGPRLVLDADIAQCFDKISHEGLLSKIGTFPSLRRQVKSWLKSGVMNEGVFENTEAGTPQGGVISPLLANIALHGIESLGMGLRKPSKRRGMTVKVEPPSIIRYADDFVIIHEEIDAIRLTKVQVEEWLKDIGLELKPSKTRLTNTEEGFNFLGFNIRRYTSRDESGKLLIKPSKEAVSRHLEKIGKVIRDSSHLSQSKLIKKLNPIIRGWTNYYDSQVSKEVFSKCDHLVYLKLQAWAKRKCPKTNAHDRTSKYWHKEGDRNWVFAAENGKELLELIEHSATKIVRHIKVQGARSPYDGDSIYWGIRLSTSPTLTGRQQKLLKTQKGKCPHCKVAFKHGDLMEVDHIRPKSLGGRDVYENLQLLHRHCHDVKTRTDGSTNMKGVSRKKKSRKEASWDGKPF